MPLSDLHTLAAALGTSTALLQLDAAARPAPPHLVRAAGQLRQRRLRLRKRVGAVLCGLQVAGNLGPSCLIVPVRRRRCLDQLLHLRRDLRCKNDIGNAPPQSAAAPSL